MKIPRDVLLDLLPLYLAGEAREETRALVERHLGTDAELGRIAERMKVNPPIDVPGLEAPDSEMKAFARMKYLVFQRTVFLLLAVASTAFFAVAMGFLIDTHPTAGPTSFVLTVIFWVAFWINGRRLSRL